MFCVCGWEQVESFGTLTHRKYDEIWLDVLARVWILAYVTGSVE